MKTLNLAIILGIGIVFVIVIGLVPLFARPTGFRFTGNPLEDATNNCGQFYIIPENQHDLYTVPVLLMNSNSTACVKLTFTIGDNYGYNDTTLLGMLRQQVNFRIGDYNVATDSHSFGITSGKDYTSSFHILSSVPVYDDPVNHKLGTNFTMIYFIQAVTSANGFYDYSIPKPNCGFYPMAVGYTADQVNSSDFSKVNPLGHTCKRLPYELTSVQISDMTYKELRLQPMPFK
jgi:hypothetical protein